MDYCGLLWITCGIVWITCGLLWITYCAKLDAKLCQTGRQTGGKTGWQNWQAAPDKLDPVLTETGGETGGKTGSSYVWKTGDRTGDRTGDETGDRTGDRTGSLPRKPVFSISMLPRPAIPTMYM